MYCTELQRKFIFRFFGTFKYIFFQFKKEICGGKFLRTLRRIYIIIGSTARLRTTHLLIWMMCPSSTPLSFMDLSACCVQTLRPNTFKFIVFFRSSGEPFAEQKSQLDPWKQLLHRHMRANNVIWLLSYLTSLCEEGLCTVLWVICVTGSVQDGSRSLETANKFEWFYMSFCWTVHRL